MPRFTIYFECAHKFGAKVIEAGNTKEAIKKAPDLIRNRAWCEDRCDKCKLKLSTK